MLSERLNELCVGGWGGSKIVRKFARKHLGRRSAKKQSQRPKDGPMNEGIDQQTDRTTDGQIAQHSGWKSRVQTTWKTEHFAPFLKNKWASWRCHLSMIILHRSQDRNKSVLREAKIITFQLFIPSIFDAFTWKMRCFTCWSIYIWRGDYGRSSF